MNVRVMQWRNTQLSLKALKMEAGSQGRKSKAPLEAGTSKKMDLPQRI